MTPPIRPTLSLVISALVAAPASAQFDAVPWSPGEPVHAAGETLVHDVTGDAVYGFSATTRMWHPLSPTGSEVVGVGERVALIREGGGHRFWSSVRNQSVFRPGSAGAIEEVGAAVALVVRDEAGTVTAHAYSALTNDHASLPLASASLAAGDVAVSDHVIAIRDGAAYHGFAARTGTWATFSDTDGAQGDVPLVDGNVALASLFDPTTGFGKLRFVAFSGVLGTWAESPLFHFSNTPHLGRDVAFVRVQTEIISRFRACGYSAYGGQWITASTPQVPVSVVQHGSDGLMIVEDLGTASRLRAFGARTEGWKVLSGDHSLLSLGDECAVAVESGTGTLHGLSGLRAAGWIPRSAAAPSTRKSQPDDRFSLVQDASGALHAFSSSNGDWAAPFAAGDDPLFVGDSVAGVTAGDGPYTLHAYSARWNRWVSGPTVPVVDGTAIGGSVVAWRTGTTFRAFDERGEDFVETLLPAPPAQVAVEGDVLLASTATTDGLHAWSSRRADWSVASAGTLGAGPEVEGEVSWLVDSAGMLVAFGARASADLWYEWPNGPDFQRMGAGFSPPMHAGISIAGAPGETAFLYFAPALAGTPLVLPGIGGEICLALPGAVEAGAFPLGASGVQPLAVPLTGVPLVGVQLWLQPVLVDLAGGTVRFGAGCGAAWFF